jgi:hypothetical protein
LRGFAGISLKYEISNIDNGLKKSGIEIKQVMIEGIIPVVCIFCRFTTCIEFDLWLHLYDSHTIELVKLPIGKGSVDFRIEYAINEGRRVGEALHLLDGNSNRRYGVKV